MLVLDTDIQQAFATLVAGSEFGIDPLDPSILLEDLQLVLQRIERHRRLAAKFEAIVDVGRTEPAIALDVDLA